MDTLISRLQLNIMLTVLWLFCLRDINVLELSKSSRFCIT